MASVPAFDPRLLRRARAVRRLLVADAAVGVAMALLVLAQAVLLARVAARAFDGASLADVARPLGLLVAVVVARSAAAWAFEVAGRRAAADVVSQLRLDLVEARLRGRPTALDGAESAEIATAAVSGVDALETSFARYLPQLVLALVVPVAVLSLVASVDLLAAGVMVLTLPLVPLFMWLVGRYTERRARERWRAMSLLANHFLDVVRGLPTLRAFNRGQAQAERIVEVSDEYRRASMGTLRAAFLSGAVLELAATLGIALVAVVVGVSLAEGDIGFEPALTVLVLAPELYLPLRNLAAQFHASADGAAVAARMLDLSEAPAVPAGRSDPGGPRDGDDRVRAAWRSAIRSATVMPCGTSTSSSGPARRSRSSARAEEARPRSCRCSSASRSRRRAGSSSGGATSRRSTRRRGAEGSRSSRSGRRSSAARSPTTSVSAIQPPTTFACDARPSSPERTTSSPLSPTRTRRSSATAAVRSRQVSGGGSRSPGHSSATRLS